MGQINLSGLSRVIDTIVNAISSLANFAGHLGVWLVVIIFAIVIFKKLKNR